MGVQGVQHRRGDCEFCVHPLFQWDFSECCSKAECVFEVTRVCFCGGATRVWVCGDWRGTAQPFVPTCGAPNARLVPQIDNLWKL